MKSGCEGRGYAMTHDVRTGGKVTIHPIPAVRILSATDTTMLRRTDPRARGGGRPASRCNRANAWNLLTTFQPYRGATHDLANGGKKGECRCDISNSQGASSRLRSPSPGRYPCRRGPRVTPHPATSHPPPSHPQSSRPQSSRPALICPIPMVRRRRSASFPPGGRGAEQPRWRSTAMAKASGSSSAAAARPAPARSYRRSCISTRAASCWRALAPACSCSRTGSRSIPTATCGQLTRTPRMARAIRS